jgi:hypothetical protein
VLLNSWRQASDSLSTTPIQTVHFDPAFLGGRLHFHQSKGQETLSRSHSDFSTSNDGKGMIGSCSSQLRYVRCAGEFKVVFLKLLLIFKNLLFFFYLCLVKTVCNNSVSDAGWLCSLSATTQGSPRNIQAKGLRPNKNGSL